MAQENKQMEAHTAHDVFTEALNRIVKSAPTNVKEVSPEEILKVDNEVRAEWGMRALKNYPIFEKEWIPSLKKTIFQKLIKAEIVREPGKLPVIRTVFEEAEGFDAINEPGYFNQKVDDYIEANHPGLEIVTPEIKKAAKDAVVRQEQMKRSGEIIEKKSEPEEVEVEPARRPGRPKGS